MGRSLRGVEDEGRRRPLGPGVVYGAFSLVLLAVVGLVSLSALQPPPPAIAEFAPQAQETITDAPSEQSSSFGSGTGDCPAGSIDCLAAEAAGGQTGQAADSPGPIDVPRVRRCVGSPPRQTEDPQSPPCVPYWDGDNGGATSRGVTRDGIIIAVPGTGEVNRDNPWFDNMLAHFNRRYEFYGRKLIPEVYSPRSGVEGMSADAAHVDVVIGAFASLRYAGRQGHESIHYDELARRGIISVARTPLFAEDYMREHRPYLWGYPMANDRMFSSIAEWICARLAGGKAVHGGPLMETRDRKFGLVFQVTSGTDNPASTAPLEKRLSACGIEIETRARYAGGTDTLDPAKAAASADAMNRGQVTTIICLCDSAVMGGMGRASTAQGYFPEWLMSTYIQQDISYVVRAFAPPEQLEHAFGLTFLPREVRPEDHPSWRAAKEIDPSSDQYTGDPVKLTEWDIAYRGMLLLASGIQMAGPRLTPQSFEDGMRKARFPNPPDRTMPGAVGFLDGDHTMTNDAAEFWWSNDARDPYKGQPGAFCYVRGGVRHQAGQWPRGEPDPFFTGPCDSGAR